MKKILAFVGIAFFVLPGLALGAVSYSRLPSGSSITSPVSFNIALDNFITDSECLSGNTWGLQLDYGSEYNTFFYSDFVSTSTLSNIFILDLPISEYGAVQVLCEDFSTTRIFEGDDTYTIFTIISASSNPVITFPTSTASSLVANVSSLISDPGLLTLLVLVVAVPFGFYVIKKLISIIPKR